MKGSTKLKPKLEPMKLSLGKLGQQSGSQEKGGIPSSHHILPSIKASTFSNDSFPRISSHKMQFSIQGEQTADSNNLSSEKSSLRVGDYSYSGDKVSREFTSHSSSTSYPSTLGLMGYRKSNKHVLSRPSSSRYGDLEEVRDEENNTTPRTKLSARKKEMEKTVGRILSGPKVVESMVSPKGQYTFRGKGMLGQHSNIQVTNNLFGEQITGLHSSRAKYCIEALQEGCIDSFMILFELSHRQPVLVDPISERHFKIPIQKLKQIKEFLVEAEARRREGDFKNVYNLYKALADYFESEKDVQTCLYFHQKGHELARNSSDISLEGLAYDNIGQIYERLGETEKAIKSHEARLSLAEATKDSDSIKSARKNLVNVYTRFAREKLLEFRKLEEQSRNIDENGYEKDEVRTKEAKMKTRPDRELLRTAKEFFDRALKEAKLLIDKRLVANTMFELGLCLEELEEFGSSLENYRTAINMFEEMGDEEGKSKTYKRLGPLLEMQGLEKSALEVYEDLLENAQKTGNQKSQAVACEKIGLLLLKLKKHEECISYFEKNFQIAQQQANGDPSDQKAIQRLNQAKVQLGFAKGELAFQRRLQENQKKGAH